MAVEDWLKIPKIPEFLLEKIIFGPIPQPNSTLKTPFILISSLNPESNFVTHRLLSFEEQEKTKGASGFISLSITAN